MYSTKLIRQVDRIKDQERLLELIEEGDAFKILSEENMGEGFNELMKYELISFDHGKVFITDIGKQAQEEGVRNYLDRIKMNEMVSVLPDARKSNIKSYFLLAALVFSLLFLLISILQ